VKLKIRKKRALDLILSSFGIFLISPIWLAIIILIRIESPGKALFRQERVGLYEKPFTMYKFRTMIEGAQNSGTGLFSFEGDPRITRIGANLRLWSLDETLQLINVLRGNMSLVGPRPPVIGELEMEHDLPPNYSLRFTVLPGITGLAQVSGRNGLNWGHKITYDLTYIEKFHQSGVLLDLKIILKTVYVVISRKNLIEKENR
jgi:undecaprenyl phosphate N,N'-diacetylbacillosamine 1-phosphate transferase